MLTIYGVYRSRAARNIWLANELDLSFRHVPVIQHRRAGANLPAGTLHTRSPEFLAINPCGLIPAIEDDGVVLSESLAINLYLAKKYGGALGPADLAEDGLFTQWTLWAATEVEPHSVQVMFHMAMKPEAERDPKIAAAAIFALEKPFALLDAELGKREWLVGGRFTVADLNVAEVIRYALPAAALFEAAPNVARWIKACHARPAYQAMMDKRNAEPL